MKLHTFTFKWNQNAMKQNWFIFRETKYRSMDLIFDLSFNWFLWFETITRMRIPSLVEKKNKRHTHSFQLCFFCMSCPIPVSLFSSHFSQDMQLKIIYYVLKTFCFQFSSEFVSVLSMNSYSRRKTTHGAKFYILLLNIDLFQYFCTHTHEHNCIQSTWFWYLIAHSHCKIALMNFSNWCNYCCCCFFFFLLLLWFHFPVWNGILKVFISSTR